MAKQAFLSGRMMHTTIPHLRARSLETQLGIDGRDVRFQTPDGSVTNPITVVVEWKDQQPDRVRGATDVIGVDGDLHAHTNDVVGSLPAGTLFQLNGNSCEVTQDALEDRGVGIVPFRMTGQGG